MICLIISWVKEFLYEKRETIKSTSEKMLQFKTHAARSSKNMRSRFSTVMSMPSVLASSSSGGSNSDGGSDKPNIHESTMTMAAVELTDVNMTSTEIRQSKRNNSFFMKETKEESVRNPVCCLDIDDIVDTSSLNNKGVPKDEKVVSSRKERRLRALSKQKN